MTGNPYSSFCSEDRVGGGGIEAQTATSVTCAERAGTLSHRERVDPGARDLARSESTPQKPARRGRGEGSRPSRSRLHAFVF